MNEQKEMTLRALSNLAGDDLERAERAFWGLTWEQMNSPYGASGKTRQQILDGYKEHRRKVNEAIAWVNKQS